MALFLFDDYLCLRVDNLPENQIDMTSIFKKLEELMNCPGEFIRPLITIKWPYRQREISSMRTWDKLRFFIWDLLS